MIEIVFLWNFGLTLSYHFCIDQKKWLKLKMYKIHFSWENIIILSDKTSWNIFLYFLLSIQGLLFSEAAVENVLTVKFWDFSVPKIPWQLSVPKMLIFFSWISITKVCLMSGDKTKLKIIVIYH